MLKQDDQDALRVSLLADGELPASELGPALAYLAQTADARQTWDSYHLVGEVLRSGAASARAHDPAFVQKLQHRLAQDAIEFVAASALSISATGQKGINIQSANDPWWRRVAGLASVALVGVLAWQGYALMSEQAAGTQAQLARLEPAQGANGIAPASVAKPLAVADAGRAALPASVRPANSTTFAASSAAPAMMLRDPRLDALLAAHHQFGGTSALQMPSGFLRNATFDAGQR